MVDPNTWGYLGMDDNAENYKARNYIKTANCISDDKTKACKDPPTAKGSAQ